MHFFAVSAALLATAQAFPLFHFGRSDVNTTLVHAEDGAVELSDSTADLITGRDAPSKRDNSLFVVTRAIDNLENTVLDLGQLVNNDSSSDSNSKRAENSFASTGTQVENDGQSTSKNAADLVTKRDNTLFVVTRAIDDMENTILDLGQLVNNGTSQKREADNTVATAAGQATDDTQSTVQSGANLVNTKRDNSVTSTADAATDNAQDTSKSSADLVNTKRQEKENGLDIITRAIDNLENTSLALGSLLNSNSKRDDSTTTVISSAIDNIQATISSLLGLVNTKRDTSVAGVESEVLDNTQDTQSSAISLVHTS